MKKAFLISALAVALASCGGNSNQNQGGAQSADSTNAQNVESESSTSPTIDVESIEGYPANEVSKKLNWPEDEEDEWPYAANDGDSKLFFAYNYTDEEDLDVTNTVECYPMNGGGYLALHTITKEGFLGDGYIDAIEKFDAFIYKDGKLTPKNDILPLPKYQDFEANDELLAFPKKAQFEKVCKKKDDYAYRLISGQRIKVGALYEEDFPYTFYEWDGSKFVLFNSTFSTNKFSVAYPGHLAGLYVGKPAPTQLKGYNVQTKGNQMVFSRSNDEFILTLGKNNVIDTITVVSERLVYNMCAAGGCNPFGVGFSPVDDGFGMQYSGVPDYFIFKNGVWVRVVESEDGGVIEFYTSKDALKNVKGTDSKIVKPSEDAWKGETADRNAKVSIIKIYKRGGFCETCRNLNEQQKTDLIRKMYNAVANDQELTKKHIQVEDEESGYPVDYDYFYKGDRLVMVEVPSGDGTMVDKKIYVDDDCPYFCLIETRYPDGTNAFDRIYICGGIIYKYLDNSKKELPLTSEVMHREQKSISHLLFIAKSNESKAK